MRDVPYRETAEAVGALNWAVLATHPDIAFAVATRARFSSNPKMAHWNTMKCIFWALASREMRRMLGTPMQSRTGLPSRSAELEYNFSYCTVYRTVSI